jgi:methionyl-tRNA synthetase
MLFSEALQAIWALIGAANKYIDEKKPWELKKHPERRDEISTVFNRLLGTIRTVLLLAYPVIPRGANQFWQILNLPGTLEDQRHEALAEAVPPGHRVNQSRPVYQRVDAEQAFEAALAAVPAKKSEAPADDAEGAGLIGIGEFAKVDLVVAEVRAAEKVEKADKLVKLSVYDGRRERQIVAGIALQYAPDELIGKHVVLVANLKPAKLRGLVSEGMLLAAVDAEGNLGLVIPERGVGPGAVVR